MISIRCFGLALAGFAGSVVSAFEKLDSDLQGPVKVVASGRPIDVEREGHAAPFFADFDGDGKRDLLVGQYSEGNVRVYRNLGADDEPAFESFAFVRADDVLASVPYG